MLRLFTFVYNSTGGVLRTLLIYAYLIYARKIRDSNGNGEQHQGAASGSSIREKHQGAAAGSSIREKHQGAAAGSSSREQNQGTKHI